jgi:hypothetical protein
MPGASYTGRRDKVWLPPGHRAGGAGVEPFRTMATLRFVLKRLVAQRLLALAMIVTLAFSVGVLVAGPIYADSARDAIYTSEIHSAGVTVRNIRLVAFGSGGFDIGGADEEVSRATDALPVEATVTQGLASLSLELEQGETSLPLVFRDGAGEHLRVRGRFPTAPDEIALLGSIGRGLGLELGDVVTATGATGARIPMQVTALYRPPDLGGDPFWFGSEAPFPGPDSTAPAPALVSREGYVSLLEGLDLSTEFVWDVYLSLEALNFPEFRDVVGRIERMAFPEESALAGSEPFTGLPVILDLIEERTENLRVPVYLVVFQIGAVALAVLAGVASLALARQSFELAVLRSRGFTRRKLLGAQAAQTVVTALIGYPLGLAVGMGLARLATRANGPAPPGTRYPIDLSSAALVAGAIATVVGAVLLILLSLPAIRRTVVEERRALSREARPFLARIPIELFVLPVGLAAFYEVRTRGFLPVSETGSLDPLIVLAPTLLLFAASFLSLRLLLFALRRLERLIGKTRRLAPYLAGRRLARSPGTSFAISLLLVLSVGLLVVSATYRATVIQNHEDSAHQQLGADWQYEVGGPDDPLASIDRLPPRSTPVVRSVPQFDRGSFSVPPAFLAIEPDRYLQGGWFRSDYAPSAITEILQQLDGTETGLTLPPDAGELTLEVTASQDDGRLGLALAATVIGHRGEVESRELGRLAGGTRTYTASLDGDGRLLSLIVREPEERDPPGELTLTVERMEIEGFGTVDVSDWMPLRWRGSAGEVGEAGPAAARIRIDAGAGAVMGGVVPPETPIPALVSPGLQQPAVFEAALSGVRLQFRTVAESNAFPTTLNDFMVVPLRPLLERAGRVAEPSMSAGEVWAMGPDPRPGLKEAGFIPGRFRSAREITAFLSQLPQSLAVGMHFTAAAGGMGLVVVGVSVGLYFTQRRREFEFASLRAMGSGRGQISAVLLSEQGAMMLFAVTAGSLLGFGVVRLMMPYFGKSLGVAFPPPLMAIDWLWLGIYAVAIAVAAILGLALALRGLLRSSVTGVLRGEAE